VVGHETGLADSTPLATFMSLSSPPKRQWHKLPAQSAIASSGSFGASRFAMQKLRLRQRFYLFTSSLCTAIILSLNFTKSWEEPQIIINNDIYSGNRKDSGRNFRN
jgi:hypothetical protein